MKQGRRLTIRAGRTGDAEGIFEVMVKAFRVEENSSKWHNWKSLATHQTTLFRVLELDGKIISVACVSPQRLRVGRSCEIVKGDVGEVSTLPDFQGMGYGSALMRSVVEWMRENDYDISRLGGYTVFYSKFGYTPFPRRFVEFPLESVQAGARTIPAEEMYGPPVGLPGVLRPYEASRDATRTEELYQLFNGQRSGALVRDYRPQATEAEGRSAPYPTMPSQPDPLKLVYEVNGLVEGYVFATDHGKELSPSQARITVDDIAFNPARPDALEDLLKQALHISCRRGAKCVTTRLPFDASVLSAITGARIAFKLEELQGSHASNMIQIINLPSLFRKITPELTARLQVSAVANWIKSVSKPAFGVEIVCERQRVGLCVSHTEVAIAPVDNAAVRLLTDQATLLKLILGILSFEEAPIADRQSIDAFGLAVLSAWFPRQPCASGPWG